MYAGIAGYAFIRIPDYFSAIHFQSLCRTLFYAFSASDTGMDSLWIMAEKTVKRTRLEKDGAPISGAVYIGKWNNSVNGCLHVLQHVYPKQHLYL